MFIEYFRKQSMFKTIVSLITWNLRNFFRLCPIEHILYMYYTYIIFFLHKHTCSYEPILYFIVHSLYPKSYAYDYKIPVVSSTLCV